MHLSLSFIGALWGSFDLMYDNPDLYFQKKCGHFRPLLELCGDPLTRGMTKYFQKKIRALLSFIGAFYGFFDLWYDDSGFSPVCLCTYFSSISDCMCW